MCMPQNLLSYEFLCWLLSDAVIKDHVQKRIRERGVILVCSSREIEFYPL